MQADPRQHAQSSEPAAFDADAVLGQISRMDGLAAVLAPATFSKDAMGAGFAGVMWNPGEYGWYVYFDVSFGTHDTPGEHVKIFVGTPARVIEVAPASAPLVGDSAAAIAAWMVVVAEPALLAVQRTLSETQPT